MGHGIISHFYINLLIEMKKKVNHKELKLIKSGKAIFQQNTNRQLLKKIQIIQILRKKTWCIKGFQRYQQHNWKKVFQQMIQCQVTSIELAFMENPKIIKQIQYVDFKILKELWINDNKIQNIENLFTINFNSLESICLSSNHISRINCFNKLSLPLNNLSLCDNPINPITQIFYLTRSSLNPNQFRNLNININKFTSLICPDLNVIVKLNSKLMKVLISRQNSKIIRAKNQQVLLWRFPSLFVPYPE